MMPIVKTDKAINRYFFFICSILSFLILAVMDKQQLRFIRNTCIESKTSPVFTKEMCFIAKRLLRENGHFNSELAASTATATTASAEFCMIICFDFCLRECLSNDKGFKLFSSIKMCVVGFFIRKPMLWFT